MRLEMKCLVYKDAKGNSLFPTPHRVVYYLTLEDLLGLETGYTELDGTELKFLSWINYVDVLIEGHGGRGKLISARLARVIPLIGDE